MNLSRLFLASRKVWSRSLAYTWSRVTHSRHSSASRRQSQAQRRPGHLLPPWARWADSISSFRLVDIWVGSAVHHERVRGRGYELHQELGARRHVLCSATSSLPLLSIRWATSQRAWQHSAVRYANSRIGASQATTSAYCSLRIVSNFADMVMQWGTAFGPRPLRGCDREVRQGNRAREAEGTLHTLCYIASTHSLYLGRHRTCSHS